MKRRLTLGLALLAGALVAALVSPLSRAELPGKNGRIAYMVKDQAGYWQVWVANSDLSGAEKVATSPRPVNERRTPPCNSHHRGPDCVAA